MTSVVNSPTKKKVREILEMASPKVQKSNRISNFTPRALSTNPMSKNKYRISRIGEETKVSAQALQEMQCNKDLVRINHDFILLLGVDQCFIE